MSRVRTRSRVAPIGARRRSRPSLVARARMMWVALLIAAIVIGALGYAALSWQGFNPRVAAVSGNQHVTTHDVIAAAGLNENVNLWVQSKRAAQARIEALPYVKSAHIHRTLPATVTIAIRERVPAAFVVQSDGTLALIDAEGRILQRRVARSDAYIEFTGLRAPAAPAGSFISDAAIARLLADARTLGGLDLGVRSMGFEPFEQLAIVTRSGLRVQFGSDADLAAKVRLIDPILRTVGLRLGRVAALDLRAPKTPIVVYR